MKVNVRGVIYGSVREAASANGVSEQAVYKMLQRGVPERIGMPVKCKRPVTIGGVSFDSISALARYIGKDAAHTGRALKAGPLALRNLADRVRAATEERRGKIESDNKN